MEELEKIKGLLLQNQKIIRYASENLSFDSAFSNEFIKEYSELLGKISEYEVSLEKIRYRIKGIKSDIESNVKLLSDTLELKVKKADTIKELNTEISLGKGIKLKGERLKVDTERFKVNESGVQFKGEVNATAGRIGGFLISGDRLIGGEGSSIGSGTIETAYMNMRGANAELIDCNPDDITGKRVVFTSNRKLDKESKNGSSTSIKGELSISGAIHATYGWQNERDSDGEEHGTLPSFSFDVIDVKSMCTLASESGSQTPAHRVTCSQILAQGKDWWSDERLKEDIKDLDGEKVMRLFQAITPVEYSMKGEKKRHKGYIAQDFFFAMEQAGFKGIVEKNGNYLAMCYSEIIPFRIKMIQEIYKKIKERKQNGNKRKEST